MPLPLHTLLSQTLSQSNTQAQALTQRLQRALVVVVTTTEEGLGEICECDGLLSRCWACAVFPPWEGRSPDAGSHNKAPSLRRQSKECVL
jgi:hypothetical protein